MVEILVDCCFVTFCRFNFSFCFFVKGALNDENALDLGFSSSGQSAYNQPTRLNTRDGRMKPRPVQTRYSKVERSFQASDDV